MKKYFFGICVFVLLILSTSVFAQSANWADYGLTEEAVKSLSEEEKQEILNSKTPAQTQEYYQKGIKDGSIKPEDIPAPLLYLLDEQNNQTPAKLSSEVVSCFDYYTFGSIEANIQSNSTNAVSGMTIDFFGNIKNKNAYPIVEGTLYVKIMKNIGNEKNPNGPDVVDQFVAMDNVTLPANGSVPLAFTWNIPAYAVSGDYRVVTYFTSDKKFNLQGLSFTDDIVGNSFDFTVSGSKTGMQFDKSSVIINDNPYYFAAYPPRIEKGEKANISLEVLNDTAETQSAHITWKLYKWDAMNPSNLIRTFDTNTQIQANSKGEVSVSISEQDEPVYFLVGELTYKDTKSIVNIRYVRDDVDKVRLNFPGITSYPLKEGEQTTLFTCLHNSGQSDQVLNNKVILEVKDKKGRVVESYTYEGIVTGDMMAVKKDFTPKTNLDVFSVHASLYSNGELVDESVMEYDCALIDPTSCTEKQSSAMQIIIGLASIIFLIVILILLKKKTKGVELMLVLFVILSAVLFLDMPPSNTGAQTVLPANLVNPNLTSGSQQVVWSTIKLDTFYYFWNNSGNTTASGWSQGLKNPNITVKYNTKITNLDTNQEITNNSTVNIGDRIKLQFIPHHPYDIYWFGTGYSGDSPYGEWATGATPPALVNNRVTCEQKDFLIKVKITTGKGTYSWLDVHIPFVISPPAKTIISGSNLSCGAVLGDENTGHYSECTVTGAGVLNPQLNFKDTFGKFYYRYFDHRDSPDRCEGNQVPLIDYQPAIGETSINSYILQVPPQTISYTLTAVAPPAANQPPNPPTITGASTSTPSTSETFSLVATDPDSNQIKYEIDWDATDGVDTINQILPSTGLVNSGVSQSTTKSWPLGTYTFKARTVDQNFATSTWAQHTITISNSIPSSISISCSPSSQNLIIPLGSSSANATINSTITGGSGTYTYKWYKGSTPTLISGATASSYTATIATSTNQSYPNNNKWSIPYIVNISNGTQSATSSACSVSVTDNNNYNTNQYYTLTTLATNGSITKTVGNTPTSDSNFLSGTQVVLTATPNTGYTFSGWSGGGCSGTNTTCTVTMDGNKTVTATFTLSPSSTYTLRTISTGSGSITKTLSGTVTSASSFAPGTQVVLTAIPGDSASFSGWSGDCTGTNTTCTVVMSSDKTVYGTFTQPPSTQRYTLTTSTTGSGSITKKVNNTETYDSSFPEGTQVVLTANPGDSAFFSGWSDDCSGTNTTCTVVMSSNKTVTATFTGGNGGGGDGGGGNPTTKFKFVPNIANTPNGCLYNLEATNVQSCYIKNRLGNILKIISPLLGSYSISLTNGYLPIGAHTLWCADTGGMQKQYNTEICYSNADFRED